VMLAQTGTTGEDTGASGEDRFIGSKDPPASLVFVSAW